MDESSTTLALLDLENPVFRWYVVAAAIALAKLMLQPWMTVLRMLRVNAGFRSPEDANKSPSNPRPRPGQLEPNEYVERSRRLNLNDLESIPGFLVAGLLFVICDPPLLFAQLLFGLYLGARAAHFVAYSTAQVHDLRAALWALSVLVMIGWIARTICSIRSGQGVVSARPR